MNNKIELSDNTYIMYAMKNYNNPQCLDIDEFHSDLNRIKYLKKLMKRYLATGEMKDRLILNHIIILYNVFGIIPATRLLFFKTDIELHPMLKTFITYLNYLPEGKKLEEIIEVDILPIPLDEDVVKILREV
mgnify:CR=1 FL=1|jgi:hypothetical protein